jgi:hypothetical protein
VDTGFSDAQELKSSVAATANSEVRMVSFFIVRWFSSKKDSSQVPSADVLERLIFAPAQTMGTSRPSSLDA